MRKQSRVTSVGVVAFFGWAMTMLLFSASAVASPQPAPGPASSAAYTVQPGDSLHAISSHFGSSVRAIVEANGIQNPDLIWPGQILVIPAGLDAASPASSDVASQSFPLQRQSEKDAPAPMSSPQQAEAFPPANAENPTATANAEMNEREAAMLDEINARRAEAGLPRLRFEPSLMPIARARSNDMATRSYFSHTTPEGMKVQDLAQATGLDYPVIGEILARNNYPVEKSVEVSMTAFMKSDNHRAHILSSIYTIAAVGEARAPQGMQYYTVLLGDRR